MTDNNDFDVNIIVNDKDNKQEALSFRHKDGLIYFSQFSESSNKLQNIVLSTDMFDEVIKLWNRTKN